MAITTFNTNIAAFGAQRNIKNSSAMVQSSLSKLSSGLRVPTAKDDAAALAIGSNLRAEVAGLKQASVNAGQATSLLQIAEGAMGQVGEILVRMKSLAVQASSGQLSDTDRSTLNSEFQALKSEIARIAADSEFNGTKLLNTSSTSTLTNINESNAEYTSFVNASNGFETVEFDPTFGSGAVKVEYATSGSLMTVTNMVTGASQSINIGSTAVAAGQIQTVDFSSIGVTVKLNSFFDKTANLGAADSLTIDALGTTTFTAGAITPSSIRITSVAQDATPAANGSTTFDFGSLNSARVTLVGAAATATISITGLYADGSAATLAAAGTVDLTALGLQQLALTDANGNVINLEFNVSTAFAGTGTAPTDYIELNELGTFVGATSVASTGASFDFKIGTGVVSSEDTIGFTIDAVTTTALGVNGSTIDTAGNADTAIGAVNTAISRLSLSRANVGAAQSRLDFASNNLAVSIENSEAARSALLDVDVAEEITNFTTKQVLLQAGVSMLAQANQLPQNLLELLR